MSNKRNISADGSTMLSKIVLPALFFLTALVGNIILLFNIESEGRFFVLFWSAVTAWIMWDVSRLKWVSVDENFIYAAGWRREIRIPLSEVESVDVSYMRNPKRITLLLKSPTEFGRKIIFLPEQRRWFESMRESHPIADELRAMTKALPESRR